MMIGLSIVLGASLLLFVGSLAYAVLEDWAYNNRIFQKLVAEQVEQAARQEMPRTFQRAARRPARVLGSFIL